MIAFALPWLFALGAVASLGVVALHFLSVRQPPELLLPTARFLDEGQVRAVSSSAQPSDLLLLMLRVLALLLACAALAGPRWVSRSNSTARIVVADVALRGDSVALRRLVDSTAAQVVVRFVWSGASGDSGGAASDAVGWPRGIRVDLTAALPMAVRAAASVATAMPDIDSLSLYVVTPTPVRVSADAWRAWRTTWPGAVHLRTSPTTARDGPTDSIGLSAPRLRFDTSGVDVRVDDPVRAAFNLPAAEPAQSIVVRRGEIVSRGETSTADPSADVTIVWPVSGVPPGWRPVSDSSGAVVAHGVALVASWQRTAIPPADGMRGARAIAWWGDGTPAALEYRIGAQCLREVGIAVAPSSDLLLDANARGVLSALRAPCGELAAAAATAAREGVSARVNDSLSASVTDLERDPMGASVGDAAAPAAYFRADSASRIGSMPRWLTPVLLALALLLLLAEWFLRDRAVVHL